MVRIPLFALLFSCSTATVSTTLPPGAHSWPALGKVAFLPIQVRIDVDGAPITEDSLARVQRSVQADTERAVGHENLDARTFFALFGPWQDSALALGHWLEASPCRAPKAPAAARLASLLDPVRADAAVYIELHANLGRDAIARGHTVVGRLAGGVAVATLAATVALGGAASGSPYLELPVEEPAVQQVARDLEGQRFGATCADHVDLSVRDAPGLSVGGRASVTVAVLGADHRLLWFRRGRLPLLRGDPARSAALLAAFVRAD